MVGGSYSNLQFSAISENNNQNTSSVYHTQSFQEQRQVDAFIRCTKLIKIVQTEAENFVKNFQSSNSPEGTFNAIFVRLPFVYPEFLNHHADLLHFLIEEPVQFNNAVKYSVFGLLRDIVKDLCHSAKIDKLNIDIDQIHVFTCVLGLPLQKDLCFQPHLNLYRTGLSQVIGILSAVTQPEKVVIQSVWYCSVCERNTIRTHLLDAPSCINCRNPMNEYSKLRYSQNFHLLRILPAESIEPPRKLNKIFRATTVRLSEQAFDCKLILGNRYLIIGHYNYFSQKQEFEAWTLTSI